MPSALAADVFVVKDRVNFRNGPSTDSKVIKTLAAGTSVEVIEHDPACWSKVKVSGTVGYVRSDFLYKTEKNVTFKATTRVNFRTEASIDSKVIRTINPGTGVEVIEHDPAGWSKVSHDGTVGYIRSDYISRTYPVVTHGEPFYAAIVAGVSTSNSAPRAISDAGVELLNWSVVKTIFKKHVSTPVLDLKTGLMYNIQTFSNGKHADVEPMTKEDTAILKQTFGGVWKWDPRPVWVYINGRVIAASINGMPHGGGTIPDNGMNGQICLHFYGSSTHNGNQSFARTHQNEVLAAYNWK
jgi:uncharacterized protein YgiM (DUF1202 family)